MIRNDMRRPTNEHEIFRGRMKQGNSTIEFGKIFITENGITRKPVN